MVRMQKEQPVVVFTGKAIVEASVIAEVTMRLGIWALCALKFLCNQTAPQSLPNIDKDDDKSFSHHRNDANIDFVSILIISTSLQTLLRCLNIKHRFANREVQELCMTADREQSFPLLIVNQERQCKKWRKPELFAHVEMNYLVLFPFNASSCLWIVWLMCLNPQLSYRPFSPQRVQLAHDEFREKKKTRPRTRIT